MILGYNTNGLAHHDPIAALELLADTGFQCVSLTIDHQWISPFASDLVAQRKRLNACLRRLDLSTVIETGARFLLDPRRKHFPSLVASVEEAAPRVKFIEFACQVAAEQGSHCVSIWSGAKPKDWDLQKSWDSLALNLESCLKFADQYDVEIGFEPEPGMFVETIAAYERLLNWVSHPRLKLTMDVGHLFCQGELPIADYIRRSASRLVNVHIEDMIAGVHEHLMFGSGSMNFEPIIRTLAEVGYRGPLSVELSRHSHDAVNAVQGSYNFLSSLIANISAK